MSSPYPTLSESPESDDKPLIERILDVGLMSGADSRTKWVAGIVLLSDVLLRQDELSQRRMIAGLPNELRAALESIPQIMRDGRLQ